ncbi:HyuE hydantoin racemase [Roseobacter cerasinus]|uniref:HyuE hydantoin racemase n=1 Tax=Roseobacter cerasinus TaxID=2602289 RepID=A0A640VRC4_9RHOB|nr:aspartate/glutamate racemase family protein [Roseobacter cerasinus]GFE50232.1 HyuE hydantoin racemase [Roseobacter cerasinus]
MARIVIINPNSTASMTEAMVRAAATAAPELRFEGRTSHNGPSAIQGEEDGAQAAPHLLDLVRDVDAQAPDGIIIGCFDDTALVEAAEVARCPVLGIGQAAFHRAALRNWRFSVVTTLPVSIPVIEKNIASYGLQRWACRVRASNVAVLDLEREAEASKTIVLDEARKAFCDDGADAIILGCAGMVDLTRAARQALAVEIIDPVETAATCMRWLAG